MKVGQVVAGWSLSLVFAAVAAAGTSELITNGSFEDPVIPAGQYEQLTGPIAGWTGSAGVEVQSNGALGAGMVTPFGNQYVELAVKAPSTYSQTVSTIPSDQYALSFYLADRPSTGDNTVVVAFTGNPDATFTVHDTGAVNFQQFTETFKATAAQSTLSFTPINLSTPGAGDLLDNVSLTAASTGNSSGSGSGGTVAVPVPNALWSGFGGMLGVSILLAYRSRTSRQCR